MTEANGDDDEEEKDGSSLVHITDTYFRRVVAVNREYTSIVFRSSLALLPEAETAAFLVSRCIEALDLTDDGLGDCGIDWFEDVILTVCPEDFHVVAEAMQRRFNSHDVVYKIVELYIRVSLSSSKGASCMASNFFFFFFSSSFFFNHYISLNISVYNI